MKGQENAERLSDKKEITDMLGNKQKIAEWLSDKYDVRKTQVIDLTQKIEWRIYSDANLRRLCKSEINERIYNTADRFLALYGKKARRFEPEYKLAYRR